MEEVENIRSEEAEERELQSKDLKYCKNNTNGFSFEIKRQAETNPYAPMTEKEMLAKLKKSREQGMFRDADDVISDMRSKYGL